ncbi:abc transporter atp-binding protein, partial [Lasius niger]
MANSYGANYHKAQQGFCVDITCLDSATPVTLPPPIRMTTSTPTYFEHIPGMSDAVTSLVEEMATNVEGIDYQLDAAVGSIPLGRSGQQFRWVMQNHIAQPEPEFHIPSTNGALPFHVIDRWMRMISHPDTGYTTMAGIVGKGTYIRPIEASDVSLDMAVIQCESTGRGRNVLLGSFLVAMQPSSSGPFGMSVNIAENKLQQFRFPMIAYLQQNPNTTAVCAALVDSLK